MHRIAQSAGVGQATLYRHYIHKGDLCRDLMADTMERARVEFEIYWQESSGRPALDRLDGVITRFVSILDEKLPYLEIAGRVHTSTATVTRVAQWLRHGAGGYALALARTSGK